MALFNSNLLKEDEHAKKIISSGEDISPILSAIERKLQAVCSYNGVAIADLTVDDDDFITSNALNDYLTAFGLVKLFRAFHGSARGEKDVYWDKVQSYSQELMDAEKLVNKNTILADGSTVDDEPLGSDAFVQYKPYVM
jgi:hypothetical protein